MKYRNLKLMSFAFATAWLIGCGASSGPALVAGDSTQNGSTVVQSSSIGPTGGTVQVTDAASPLAGTAITVPTAAVVQNTNFTIADATTSPKAALPSGYSGVSTPVELGPSGVNFVQPVDVALHYTDAQLLAAGVTDESKLQIVTWSGTLSNFTFLSIKNRNTGANTITGQALHFSFFQVVSASNNTPTSVAVNTPSGQLSGNIAINFILTDPDPDALTISVQYRGGSAGSSFRNATVTGQTTGLSAGTYWITWESHIDEPGQNSSDYVISIACNDGTTNSVAGYTAMMHVDNSSATPPTNNGWTTSFAVTDSNGVAVSTVPQNSSVKLRLTATNGTGKIQTVTYPSSQTYEFTASDANGNELYRWSTAAGIFFTQAFVTTSVNPGQTLNPTVNWSLTDNSGNALPAGTYTVTGTITGTSAPDAFGTFAPVTLAITSGNTGGGALTATMITEDANGNPTSTFTVGNSVHFRITLFNGTSQNQTVTYTGGCYQRSTWSIVDSNGTFSWLSPLPSCAAPPPGAPAPVAPPETMAPGQSLTYQGAWFPASTQAAGTYTASGSILGNCAPTQIPAFTSPTFTLVSSGGGTNAQITGSLTLLDNTGTAVTTVSAGSSYTWQMVLTNTGSSSVTLSFATGQQYDFNVTSPTPPPGSGMPIQLFWHWSNGKSFTQATTTLTIAAGATHTFSTQWNVVDNSGAALPAGSYEGHGSVPHNGTSTTTVGTIPAYPFTVSAGSSTGVTYSLVLKDSAGAVQSTFSSGATITLEYTITNGTNAAVTYNFSSGHQYDFAVTNANGVQVWLMSSTMFFTQAFTNFTVAAFQTQTFTSTYSAGSNGTYSASAWLVGYQPASNATTPFSVGANAADTIPPSFNGLSSATLTTVTTGANGVQLTWSAASDNVTAATGITYNIYRYTNDPRVMYFVMPSMNYSTPYATVTNGTLTFTDTNLTTGGNVVHYYAVRAVDAAGNEDSNTTELSVTVP
ncbi:MAG: BsuPI-related putative proteinase inhibitor [Planctomycetes bacterium]|nr:BsuPI-related putative proteinase inhibitor [Planctomycetota bacterium]